MQGRICLVCRRYDRGKSRVSGAESGNCRVDSRISPVDNKTVRVKYRTGQVESCKVRVDNRLELRS